MHETMTPRTHRHVADRRPLLLLVVVVLVGQPRDLPAAQLLHRRGRHRRHPRLGRQRRRLRRLEEVRMNETRKLQRSRFTPAIFESGPQKGLGEVEPD